MIEGTIDIRHLHPPLALPSQLTANWRIGFWSPIRMRLYIVRRNPGFKKVGNFLLNTWGPFQTVLGFEPGVRF